ncbi:transketolase [Nonomuraea sp. NPDC048826]|uniref:transketolase n=1 Tax=Nonomuraea sp. NPDC048826 TaxID=3364347 RepID=UPI003718DF83
MPASEGASLTTSSEVVERIRERAQFVRLETVRLISIAKTGHYSSTFSCAEILATLYYGVLRLRRGDPDWMDRDRFVMGKGHAAVGLYPILADHGFFDPELLDGYTRLGNPLGDHPDMTKVPGCDFSSGSLGHNLSVGLGMALGARMTGRDFNVYALLGDGELHEGQIWEAAAAAGHYGVGNLVAIVDRNGYCLDGKVDDIITIEPLADRWRAFGWDVVEVDGHDVPALLDTLLRIRDGAPAKPTAVIAHTVKGKGVGFMERDFGWHLGWLAEQDEAAVIRELKDEK